MIDSFYKTLIYDDRYKYILEGLKNTLVIAFFAILIGIILGILISLVKNRYKENGKGKILNGIANIYVTIIRGTPAVLQLMILYYVIFKKLENYLDNKYYSDHKYIELWDGDKKSIYEIFSVQIVSNDYEHYDVDADDWIKH